MRRPEEPQAGDLSLEKSVENLHSCRFSFCLANVSPICHSMTRAELVAGAKLAQAGIPFDFGARRSRWRPARTLQQRRKAFFVLWQASLASPIQAADGLADGCTCHPMPRPEFRRPFAAPRVKRVATTTCAAAYRP